MLMGIWSREQRLSRLPIESHLFWMRVGSLMDPGAGWKGVAVRRASCILVSCMLRGYFNCSISKEADGLNLREHPDNYPYIT